MNSQLPLAATLLATLALACGGETPIELEQAESEPDPPELLAPVAGDTVYAVDLRGRFLVFGTESAETVSKVMPIRGVPFLRRIVGIGIRPSNGLLYGVGNDSRVYVIDRKTAVATAVSDSPFTPTIAAAFDTHFGMAFEPWSDKIRLVSTDFGVNWLIDPDDGTAEVGERVRFAPGDPNETRRLKIAALVYPPPEPEGVSSSLSPALAVDPICEWLGMAIDTAWGMASSCDRDGVDWESLLEINGSFSTCAAMVYNDGNIIVTLMDAADGVNKLFGMDPETGERIKMADIGTDAPVQAMVIGFLRRP